MYNLFKVLGLSFIFLITTLVAQPRGKGKISGTAVDAETGDPLIGANVYLENTSLGSASDLDGNFLIMGVPAGNYTLIVSVIGYAETKITDVIVKNEEITKINIAVQSEILTTEAVVVEAEALQNTEAALLKSRQKSISVSDAISAEEISKSGSGDAAAAMKKVTGASVVGGKYVYIRGLGERYSATTLNGAELPSADPDKKSFQLDLIPSNMLDNINTIKTFTPDKAGTFTGGLVDVSLKTYPEQLTFQINSSTGYNSQATGNNNFILPNSGGTDWLGMDDGTREIPDIVKNRSGDVGKINSLDNDTPEELNEVLFVDRLSNSFNNKMIPTSANEPLNGSFGISVGNTVILDEKQNNSIGYFGSLTWGQNYSFIDNAKEGRYKLVGPLSEVEGLEADFEGTGSKGTMEVNWGSIANLALKNKTLGQVKFSYMHTQNAEATGQYLIGVRERDRSTDRFETTVSKWVERSLDTYQADGEHMISPFFNSKLDWKISKSTNKQDEPDQRYFFDVMVDQPDGSIFYMFDAANSQPISRYYRDLTEDNLSAYTNLEFSFKQWSDRNSKLKVGFAYNQIDRVYNQRRFDYVPNRMSLNDFAENNVLNTERLFSAMGISDSTSRPDRPSRWFDNSFIIDEAVDSTGFFRGDLETFAYYLMINLPIIENLRFIGGARIESTTMNSKTLDPEDGKGKLTDTDVLPSINFVYSLHKNMNIRTAFSRTIARPTFRELAPYISFEYVGDELFIGNPNLKRTLITNYDIRWEWFLNPGEILAVSGFYKAFEAPIEKYIDPKFSDDTALKSVKNVDRGTVLGLEIEARKDFGFIYEKLSAFKIGTNFSYVHSQVDIADEEIQEKIDNGDPNPDKTRPLAGQSPYLFNINFSYDNYKSGTSAGLYYNLFGDRLFLTARHATPDIYEKGYGTLDFKASQDVFNHFTISLAVKNILNPKHEFIYKLDNGVVDKDYIYRSIKTGINYSLSLTYKL